LRSLIPSIRNKSPRRTNTTTTPPFMNSSAAIPQDAKNIPGSARIIGTITSIKPSKISSHLFMFFLEEGSLKAFLLFFIYNLVVFWLF